MNVSRNLQKIFIRKGDRWHISEGFHQGEYPRECGQNNGGAETDRTTTSYAQVPNTPLINGRQIPGNDGGIQRGRGGAANLESSKP